MSNDHKNYFHERQIIPIAEHAEVSLFFEAVFDPTADANDSEASEFQKAVGGLTIPTGADEITWGYGLNTKRTPTYGGEVVQILSMYADKMTIKGTCRTYNEMNKIYEYFKNYISYTTGAKGLDTKRHQKFLKFRYPARSWSFVIMVDDISSFRMSKDIAAPVWSLTAEIVSENDRYALGSQRADRWASALDQPMAGGAARSGGVYGPKNFKLIRNGDAYGDQMSAAGRRGLIAANFDALVASWATGDITTLRTNPLVDPAKSAEEIWTQNFGDFAGSGAAGVAGGGGTVGGTTPAGSTLSGTLTGPQMAAIASNGLKPNYSDKYKDPEILATAIAIAAAESSWKTTAVNRNVSGVGKGGTYEDYIANHLTDPATSTDNWDLGLWQVNTYYTREAVGMGNKKVGDNLQLLLTDPLYNASIMATDSQGGSNWSPWVTFTKGYYQSHMAEARTAVATYLSDSATYDAQVLNGGLADSGGGPVIPPDLTNDIRQNAIAWANWMHKYSLKINYVYGAGHGGEYGTRKRTTPPSLPMDLDCSSSVSYCFLWAGAGGGIQATAGMEAWDIPGGIGSVGPGDMILTGGPGATHHVVMVLEKIGSTTFKVFSHGGKNGEYGAGWIGQCAWDTNDYGPNSDFTKANGPWQFVRWPGVA